MRLFIKPFFRDFANSYNYCKTTSLMRVRVGCLTLTIGFTFKLLFGIFIIKMLLVERV